LIRSSVFLYSKFSLTIYWLNLYLNL
jgi:hypothetical protein